VIEIAELTKTFRDGQRAAAVDGVSLEVGPGEFFTLLGPSGCGKSTLLRCVAGLETPDEGRISINGVVMFDSQAGINVPPNRRHLGMVFQSYAVWPHMTVYENVAFPLEVQGISDIPARVQNILALVGLEEYSERYAPKLSGGQQQRVALARAIVTEPQVLLLDEPLSNLDAALREQMRSELRALQQNLYITSIYVTHDQAEALSMSDQIAVMRHGRVLEISAPEKLYRHPRHVFSAEFLGSANILTGQVVGPEPGSHGTLVHTAVGILQTIDQVERDSEVLLFIRPEGIEIESPARAEGSRAGQFDATVTDRQFIGDTVELRLEAADGVILSARVSSRNDRHVGDDVHVCLDPSDVRVLPGNEDDG
jgi:iron(III) transport system ATP-binding protein